MAGETNQELEDQVVRRDPRWIRRYPPLVFLGATLLIVILILPTALNLPQSNPTTVLEYAPIPPEDDEDPPPAQGTAISSLGLGTSEGLTSGIAPDTSIPGPGGKGKKPITKKCVGKPLRQTEDPNSPPCVPFFEGDNGGATWQGVTGDEIVVLIYNTGNVILTSTPPEETPPANSYCDVDKAPDSQTNCLEASRGTEDHREVRTIRALSRYFNDRYQTYNRHVHFYIYWSDAGTPAGRRAEAQDNWETLQPFAVIDRAFFRGFNDVYADAMARYNSMLFGQYVFLPNKFYSKLSPMIWSFWPDVEHMVDLYVSYVCTKLKGKPASKSGTGIDKSGTRKFAFLYTTDPNWNTLTRFAQIAKGPLKECLGKDVVLDNLTYSRNQYSNDTHPDAPREAQTNIATMQANDVTTVLWLTGFEVEHSKAATAAGFFPEWVVAGDTLNAAINNARDQNSESWRYAWVVTNFLREDRNEDAPGRQAYREGEPNGRELDESLAGIIYPSLFMLFQAIQVSGPVLGPDTVDQGLHAIPRRASPSPYVAACFYDPGDYTCVKDAHEAWWDPNAADPDGDPDEMGCWRMVDGGKRYLARKWPIELRVRDNPQDPCNTVISDSFIHPYGPVNP